MTSTVLLAAVIAAAVASTTAPATKLVALSKVVVAETAPVKGRLRVGLLCMPNGTIVGHRKQTKAEDGGRYDALFAVRMKALGFTVDAASSGLFAQEAARDAAYLIGATIRPVTVNSCTSVKGEKGSVALAVDWQVFERATHNVVAAATTTGNAEQLQFAHGAYVATWNQAFAASLDAFVALGILQRYVGTPTAAAVSRP